MRIPAGPGPKFFDELGQRTQKWSFVDSDLIGKLDKAVT